MKFTNELPTQEGYYFYKGGPDFEVAIFEVRKFVAASDDAPEFQELEGKLVVMHEYCTECWYGPDTIENYRRGLWAGPIPLPENL